MATFEAFEAEAGAGRLPPLCVGAGEDPWLRARFAAVLKTAAGGAGAAFEEIPAKEATPARVREALGAGILFGGRRIVLVDGGEALLAKGGAPAPPPGGSVLAILVSKAAPGVPREAIVDLSPPGPAALPRWFARIAEGLGKGIAADAAGALAERCGPDLARIESELSRLAAFVGDRPGIEAEDVRRLVAPDVERSAFDLLKALGARRAGAALRILSDLSRHGVEAEPILGALAWQARQSHRARRLAEAGAGPDRIGAALRVPPERAAWLARQAQALAAGEIERRRRLLLAADGALKGARQGGRREAILEELVVSLAAGMDAGPPERGPRTRGG